MKFLIEEQIETRDMLVGSFIRHLKQDLAKVNNAFRFIQIESPILLDGGLAWVTGSILRKETAANVFAACNDILSVGAEVRYRLPLVLWEYGKIFEQNPYDRSYRERMTLELHVLYSNTTIVAYMPVVQKTINEMVTSYCGTPFPIVDLQLRTDFPGGNDIQVVIDMNVCVEQHENRKNGKPIPTAAG